jgi:hypothetical protein
VIAGILVAMGVGRILLGLAPFVAADTVARWMAFPPSHDNPTTRLMARFFGVRDVGLGVLVFYALRHPPLLGFVLLFNAVTDLGDLGAIAIPLVGRQGIDRGALMSSAFAMFAAIGWFTMYSLNG